MNILVLSVGTRTKIIQYFKQTIHGQGKILAADMSPLAPALYEADQYYVVPRITDPGYIDEILLICQRENVSGVLSLIDPELSLLAANHSRFESLGITVIGSEQHLCERALDKMEMFRWLSAHGYSCARSYTDIDAFFEDVGTGRICYPVFVKPVRGSASISIHKAYNWETVELLLGQQDGLMIQEFLDGQEIGADCYIDMVSGELVSVFTKKKLLMRAGETDKSVSFKDPRLFELIKRFTKESGWSGPIDIDIFDIGGNYYISEVNPRFGGGYLHAYECGCNFMSYIMDNLSGRAVTPVIGNYADNVVMMKYNEILVKKAELNSQRQVD